MPEQSNLYFQVPWLVSLQKLFTLSTGPCSVIQPHSSIFHIIETDDKWTDNLRFQLFRVILLQVWYLLEYYDFYYLMQRGFLDTVVTTSVQKMTMALILHPNLI